MPFTASRIGLVLAAIYIAIAVWVVISERSSPGGGNWISLNGMASFLVTFPVSAPLEILGSKPDYQKNVDIGGAILACAVLAYFVGAGVDWLIGQMLRGPDS